MAEFQNAYSLVIGVGNYIGQGFGNLLVTIQDAQAIQKTLTDSTRCGYLAHHVRTLTRTDATGANVRAGLEWLAQMANTQSTVLIYFSGHGGRVYENNSWTTYLCPCEANIDNLEGTAVSGGEFSARLVAIPARKLVVMLDACHAGGAAELKSAAPSNIWKSGLPDNYYERLSQGNGRVIIASSKEDEFSFVRPQGDLSVFTWQVCQALDGQAAIRRDGFVHILDLFHYVNEKVKAEQPGQTPVLKAKDLDENFPIALCQTNQKSPSDTREISPIESIREQIINDPLCGARSLSMFLSSHPRWVAKRNEVDLKRTELEHSQQETGLFGSTEIQRAEQKRAVYFLLRMCMELENEFYN